MAHDLVAYANLFFRQPVFLRSGVSLLLQQVCVSVAFFSALLGFGPPCTPASGGLFVYSLVATGFRCTVHSGSPLYSICWQVSIGYRLFLHLLPVESLPRAISLRPWFLLCSHFGLRFRHCVRFCSVFRLLGRSRRKSSISRSYYFYFVSIVCQKNAANRGTLVV